MLLACAVDSIQPHQTAFYHIFDWVYRHFDGAVTFDPATLSLTIGSVLFINSNSNSLLLMDVVVV